MVPLLKGKNIPSSENIKKDDKHPRDIEEHENIPLRPAYQSSIHW